MPPPPVADAVSGQAPGEVEIRLARTGAYDDPLRGILLLLASTVVFAISDTAAKLMTQTTSPFMVCWVRFAVFSALAVPLALAARGRAGLVPNRPNLQVLRGLGMVVSAVLFITGLTYMPVAEMTAINFVAPVFITALSVVLLGEKVGPRRWAAALVGLAGVLVIIRPGSSTFQITALLPVASSAVWAFAAVATRLMSSSDLPETTLAYSAIVGFVVLTCGLPYFFEPIGWYAVGVGIFVGATSTLGHWFIVRAFRRAPASTIVPFTYTQLLWATGLGYFVFGNLPDFWTYVGAAIIAASGLYTAHRERVRSRLP